MAATRRALCVSPLVRRVHWLSPGLGMAAECGVGVLWLQCVPEVLVVCVIVGTQTLTDGAYRSERGLSGVRRLNLGLPVTCVCLCTKYNTYHGVLYIEPACV